jgi:capsular polysaccharide export protein
MERQVLFLQGLPGDFFANLAHLLAACGCGVHRVNFNGGDQWDWPRPGAVNYRGGAAGWPSFLARLLRERAITDVVLFGDCRPLHRIARATAAGLGVAVHVFEEGYLRPDWVTLEAGGVNGFSRLPDDPDWWRRLGETLPPTPNLPPLPSTLAERRRATIAYYGAYLLLAASFPRYRTHRPWPPIAEAWGWLTRYAGRRRAARRTQAEAMRVRRDEYFLLPLQLNSDYQLRAHSDFDGMQPALAEVIASFAAHAPAHAQLVVKAHPLDNGLIDWRRRTGEYAQALGVADRVVFLDVADIDGLVRQARGVVTVNSTTGTLALAAGVPVITLGRAVYDLPGLTDQGGLDRFWRAPMGPDERLYDAFRRVLRDRCLLYGGFYAQAQTPLLAAAADRILTARNPPARLRARRPAPLAAAVALAAE